MSAEGSRVPADGLLWASAPATLGALPKGQARLVRHPHRLCREGPLLSFLQGKGLRAPQVFSVTWGGWEREGRGVRGSMVFLSGLRQGAITLAWAFSPRAPRPPSQSAAPREAGGLRRLPVCLTSAPPPSLTQHRPWFTQRPERHTPGPPGPRPAWPLPPPCPSVQKLRLTWISSPGSPGLSSEYCRRLFGISDQSRFGPIAIQKSKSQGPTSQNGHKVSTAHFGVSSK